MTLPPGWTRARLGDLARINPKGWSKPIADSEPISFVPMAAVEAGTGRLDPSNVRPWSEVRKGFTTFEEGDVLFAKVTPCMENGKCALAAGLAGGRGAGTTELIVLRPAEGVARRYLLHFLLQESFRQAARSEMQGVAGLMRVRTSFMEQAEIPLPPREEQERIVAAIEKQFTRLDAGVEALKRLQVHLKRYRASVLKAACEGRLVPTEAELARREGRDYEPASTLIARTEAPPRPNRWNSRSKEVILGHPALAVGNPGLTLPEGWAWTPLVEIARMESGHTPSRTHPEWWDGDVAWIGIADAREYDGRTIHETLQHTNAEGIANSAARLLPGGTVCISRTASVGYVVVMGRTMATSQDFVNWIPSAAVRSDWLRTVFSADREALRRFGKGSVHKTIYFPEWLSIHVALPPFLEQARIVAEADRLLTGADQVERIVLANLSRSKRVRQSILKSAFEGKLVAQDPADEAASALLERIRASKESPVLASASSPKRSRSKAAVAN